MSFVRTHTLYPVDARHRVILEFAQLGYTAAGRVPHVHTRPESNAKGALTAPIDEIEVEVIGKIWRIKDLVRYL
jgi:hypothetical protein